MQETEPVFIILDTDMDTDCDDVGALAVLHRLMDEGKVQIGAVVCDTVVPSGAPCIEYINRYYRRASIPVGTIGIEDYDTLSRYENYRKHVDWLPAEKKYNRLLAEKLHTETGYIRQYPTAVEIYRKTLSEQPDHSVVICVVGVLSALEQLLKSEPDPYSSLNGIELVKRKVSKLVTMAVVNFPEGGTEAFNWRMDWEAAVYVLNHCPVPVCVSSSGDGILTGNTVMHQASAENPIRLAYEAYLQDRDEQRPSWDQVAALYAVLGAGDLFEECGGYSIAGKEGGLFHWEKDGPRKDLFIKPRKEDSHMAALIEAYML